MIPPADTPSSPSPLGPAALLLTGGGARAAYQVGVLEAIADVRRACGQAQGPNPLPIIVGTSAGGINAAALACGADRFGHAVHRMARVWRSFNVQHVYRTDSFSALESGTRWIGLLTTGWALAQRARMRPRSLLDNTPLAGLLQRLVPLQRLPALMAAGHLRALAVTASSYSSGEHVTFYQSAAAIAPWARSQRRSAPGTITHAHLLASSAIPFVFPAAPVSIDGQNEYFGDGSMRQVAPISPAIHLGANRVLVIGAGRLHEPPAGTPGPRALGYPSLAQIAGHALSSIFLDALAVDVERTLRINHTLSLIDPARRGQSALRPIELLVISPSQRLDELAARHVAELPPSVRTLLKVLGAPRGGQDIRGSALASYLLFVPGYTRALMALGYNDALAQHDSVRAFFGWPSGSKLPRPRSTAD